MNSNILVIQSKKISKELNVHVVKALRKTPYEIYSLGMSCQNRKILFVVELNNIGYDLDLLEWLSSNVTKDFFSGSTGAIIVKSPTELYTKSFAQDIILHCNSSGLAFVGHSVVEIIQDYKNFQTWQKHIPVDLGTICERQCEELINRLLSNTPKYSPNILALHSSSYKTSNTLGLWHLVKKNLLKYNCGPEEIHIENGTVVDCKGCTFQMCMHYGEDRSCFYGGVMVKEVLPAIEKADTIVWVCPNYNDSISANLLAVINRLTVLYRQITFHNKVFFAVVVSGNSGSDSVAKQLIGALNINKGFCLPPHFALMAIANEPLKVLEIEDVEGMANTFAKRIYSLCSKE